jgi:hypothetical protein
MVPVRIGTVAFSGKAVAGRGRQARPAPLQHQSSSSRQPAPAGCALARPGRHRSKGAPLARAPRFALEQQNDKISAPRYFFKIEKGEPYLMPVTFASKKGDRPDFSGNAAPVTVFKKVK